MSNFFVRKRKPDSGFNSKLKPSKVRKQVDQSSAQKRRLGRSNDEEIESSESDIDDKSLPDDNVEDEQEDTEETAQQTKLRLAKMYIEEVREKVKFGLTSGQKEGGSDEGVSEDESDEEDEKVGLALRTTSALKSGQIQKNFSKGILEFTPEEIHRFRGHKNTVTCGCVSSNGLELYTGSKDCSIIKWNLSKNVKVWMVKGHKKSASDRVCHKGQVNSLALCDDSKFLVSAGKDPEIFIWKPTDGSLVSKLKGHKSSVLSLKFKPHSYQLFSTAVDRFVKVWQVDDEVILDNLCGHESNVCCVDSFDDNPITCGSTDKSIRVWKVSESSQLVFNHCDYVDCVLYLNREYFVSGDCAGCICLWSTRKKKPVYRQFDAHRPKWITSLATAPCSDIVASGSSSGAVKLWKVFQFEKLNLLRTIEVVGCVNFISFTPDARKMILGIGRDHRLGRWEVFPECKNSCLVYKMLKDDEQDASTAV